MKHKQETLMWVLGAAGVAAVAGLAYGLVNGSANGSAPAAAVIADPAVPVSTRPGAFDSYLKPYLPAVVDYTGGLLPWLQAQLNPAPTPAFGVNVLPYTSPSAPTAPAFGVGYTSGSGSNTAIVAPLESWTPSGSAADAGSSTVGGFGVNYKPTVTTMPVYLY